MKLLFAAISLWAVAVLALRGDRTRYRYSEVVDPRHVESFRAGQTFRYQLDTQISTGIASIDQHAATRLQAEVMLHFQSERKVTLKLDDIVIGSTNRDIEEPERVQPMEMFKKHPIKPEEERLLELPCVFEYEHGLVGNVYFKDEDRAWSKNIKKTVLNMIQLNLKQRLQANIELKQRSGWEDESTKTETESKMFVLPEITLEGECQTTYTVNKAPRYSNVYDNEISSDLKTFNVTKSIDFLRCGKVADMRFGPKIEKPCDNCTSPEDLEERKLERTTVLRHMIVGTPEKYGIQKVELVSHYLFKTLNAEDKSPMHAVVAGELNYIKNEETRRREIEQELRGVSINGKEESLLYTTTWDENEKMFYMYGDEQFPRETPFDKVQDKAGKVEKLMSKLVSLWSENTKGIDTEATMVFARVVEVLRMSSQEEIRKVVDTFNKGKTRLSESEQQKASEVLIDALSNAGTFNTIKVLVEKIKDREIPTSRAVRALTQLKDLPAPSEKQVDTLVKLCQHEVCSRYQSCRQTCWFTAGAIMGELCNEELTVEDAVEQKKGSFCPADLKQKFIENIMNQYNKAETRYEKTLFLKTLGNAGLDLSVFELEKIINDIRRDPVVRMQAIDSLRRLRAIMPQKIQRILMPIFQNVRERPEIRMAAVSQILSTIPEKQILDMIGLALIREPSRQVKSYIYTAYMGLSKSPIRMERDLAQHLKALLKLAGIKEEDEETFKTASRYYRIPFFSRAQKEGFFLDLESIVGSDNVMPKHLHVGLDSIVNGVFRKSNVELSFTQEDLENWYEKILNVFMDYYYGGLKSKKNSEVRGYRTSGYDSSESDQDFRSIISSLSIKRRTDRDPADSSDSPYGVLSYRLGDVDYAIFPFDEEMLPEPLKKIVSGELPSIKDLNMLTNRPFIIHGALNLIENSVKLPTSMGLPVRMQHILPILTSIEVQIKPRIERSEVKADIKSNVAISLTHLKSIEVWSPIISTGVQSAQMGSVVLPLESTLTVDFESSPMKYKLAVKVPEQKTKLFNFHTLPITYETNIDYMQQRTPVVKRIENREKIHLAKHLEETYGLKNFDLPIKVSGEFHVPPQLTYEELVSIMMTTENHINVEFHPSSETPREIVLTGEGKIFETSNDRSEHRSLKSFYSKSKFDNEMERDYERFYDDEDQEKHRSKKLAEYLDNYEPRKMYKHFFNAKIHTVGGRREKSAKLEVRGSTDDKLRFINAQVNIVRTPLNEESREWTLKTNVQALLPEQTETHKYEERRNDKHQRFVCNIESEWGSERKQMINTNINGEQIRNKMWSEKIRELEQNDRYEMPKIREQMNRKVAFLNKYDIQTEYKNIQPSTAEFFNWGLSILKGWNLWQTKVELKNNRNGQVLATIVIDPLTHEHANVTLKTPTETIRVDSFQLPMKVKPFKLVNSPLQTSVDSFSDVIKSYATEKRAECKVDSRKVETFDDVTYKAPLTKCYSVLAKDCNNERPRFVVLMKKVGNQNKKLKMLTGSDKIEVESESRDRLVVKVNGRKIDDYENLKDYGVEYSEDMVRINTRDVSVRFDGEKAWVKISPLHKNKQCGLCGHYDDQEDDEFRMNNNELTSDIKAFHKSYSLSDDECRSDMDDSYKREQYERTWESREFNERNDNNEIKPIEKTEIIEHTHKICFSVKPTPACPEGSYAEKTKDQKTKFICMDRSEGRRLLREARRNPTSILDLPKDQNPSFTETLRVPSTCVVY